MSDPIETNFIVPAGQPIGATFFYVSELAVSVSSNEASIVLMDTLPVAGVNGVDGSKSVRRPVALVKVSPQTLKGMAEALSEAVRLYENDFGQLTVQAIENSK